MKIELVDIATLVFDPNNARKHDTKNLAAIKGSLTKFGAQKPIVINKKNVIIAGNGTVAAAKELGWKQVPAVRSELDDFMQSAYALADNRSSELAEWDMDVLKETIASLQLNDFDILSIGFDSLNLDTLTDDHEDSEYSKKIETPVYEPKGEKPAIADLIDLTKFYELKQKIDASKIPDEIKSFLHHAATRHKVFNYELIAEFYAHANAETQCLMEDSALVIIDFDKAIENGFVVLSEKLATAYANDEE